MFTVEEGKPIMKSKNKKTSNMHTNMVAGRSQYYYFCLYRILIFLLNETFGQGVIMFCIGTLAIDA